MATNLSLRIVPLLFLGAVAHAQSGSLLSETDDVKAQTLSYFQTNLGAKYGFGTGVKLRLGNNLSIGGGVGRSPLRLSDQIAAYNFNLGYDAAQWGLGGRYRRTERDTLLADTWQGIGTPMVPVGSQDLAVGGWLKLTSQMRVTGEATFGEALPGSGFDFASWSTRLEYRFARNAFGILGFDNLDVDFGGGSTVRQRLASLGVGYNMGSGSMFKLMIQYGELNAQRPWGASAPGVSRGQVISSQISIKF